MTTKGRKKRNDATMPVVTITSVPLSNNELPLTVITRRPPTKKNEALHVTTGTIDNEQVLTNTTPAGFSNRVPSPIVRTRTTNNVTSRPSSPPKVRKRGCHSYEAPEDVFNGCTYDPLVSKLSGAIEDGTIAVTKSFSTLNNKVLTPT